MGPWADQEEANFLLEPGGQAGPAGHLEHWGPTLAGPWWTMAYSWTFKRGGGRPLKPEPWKKKTSDERERCKVEGDGQGATMKYGPSMVTSILEPLPRVRRVPGGCGVREQRG